MTEQLQVAPVPASIDNAEAWQQIAPQITSLAGAPPMVTPDVLTGMIGSAVPLLFEADALKDMDLLRGTFTELVIAQCQRNAGCLERAQPQSVVVHLVGAHQTDGRPVLRTHLAISFRQPDGSQCVGRQFWDLQLGADVIVGRPDCPNCGAPLGTGELICRHCGSDVRSVVSVPIVVSRLEYY